MRGLVSVLAVVTVAAGCTGSVVAGQPDDPGAPSRTGACTLDARRACLLDDAGSTPWLTEQTCIDEAGDHVWGACEAAACSGTEFTCTTTTGENGVATCSLGLATSPCGVIAAGGCHPGDTEPAYNGGGSSSGGPSSPPECSAASCQVIGGTWTFPGCDTPIVLAFDDDSVRFTEASGDFDLAGRAQTVPTRWVSAATPWLALDRNGNGRIDDGSELFGSMTRLGNGRAPNGFVALAALDDDGDGAITPRDAIFGSLLVWRDDDQDRKSQPSELTTLGEAGVVAIHLDYRDVPVCDDGDCAVERARFDYRDAKGNRRSGEAVDVHLAPR
jgi:hypothetical protein